MKENKNQDCQAERRNTNTKRQMSNNMITDEIASSKRRRPLSRDMYDNDENKQGGNNNRSSLSPQQPRLRRQRNASTLGFAQNAPLSTLQHNAENPLESDLYTDVLNLVSEYSGGLCDSFTNHSEQCLQNPTGIGLYETEQGDPVSCTEFCAQTWRDWLLPVLRTTVHDDAYIQTDKIHSANAQTPSFDLARRWSYSYSAWVHLIGDFGLRIRFMSYLNRHNIDQVRQRYVFSLYIYYLNDAGNQDTVIEDSATLQWLQHFDQSLELLWASTIGTEFPGTDNEDTTVIINQDEQTIHYSDVHGERLDIATNDLDSELREVSLGGRGLDLNYNNTGGYTQQQIYQSVGDFYNGLVAILHQMQYEPTIPFELDVESELVPSHSFGSPETAFYPIETTSNYSSYQVLVYPFQNTRISTWLQQRDRTSRSSSESKQSESKQSENQEFDSENALTVDPKYPLIVFEWQGEFLID
jgi:hypothetical protein